MTNYKRSGWDYKLVKCKHCGFIQITQANVVFKCKKCSHSQKVKPIFRHEDFYAVQQEFLRLKMFEKALTEKHKYEKNYNIIS